MSDSKCAALVAARPPTIVLSLLTLTSIITGLPEVLGPKSTLADYTFKREHTREHERCSAFVLPSQYLAASQTSKLVPSPFEALVTSSLTTWNQQCKTEAWSSNFLISAR